MARRCAALATRSRPPKLYRAARASVATPAMSYVLGGRAGGSMGIALPATSLPVRKALLLPQKVRVELGKSDNGEKHMNLHIAISGQAFWQSGMTGLSGGQHGMSSGMEVISDISAMDASSIAAALDGAAIGAVRRPTTARAESRRAMSDQRCTPPACHRVRRERRWLRSRGGKRSGASWKGLRPVGNWTIKHRQPRTFIAGKVFVPFRLAFLKPMLSAFIET